MLKNVSFGGILFLLGLVYFSLSFLTGEMFFEMPNNWFVSWMAGIFRQMDGNGFFNVWSGQSPGFNYLYFIIWKPIQLLMGQHYSFGLIFSLLWWVIDIGALFFGAMMFYLIVKHIWGKEKGLLLGTVYILFTFTLTEWYTLIDPIPIAGLLAAIYLVFIGKIKTGGIVLGITASLKPMGLLLLPVIIKSEFLGWRARVTMIAASLGSFILVLLPLYIGNPKIFLSSFHWQSGRPPWESIYSFLGWLFNVPYPQSEFFTDASGIDINLWGATGITPALGLMTTPVPTFHTWYNNAFVVLLLLVTMMFILSKSIKSKADLLSGLLCMLSVYFTFFYGWSLQFIFWLIPFLLVCFPLGISVGLRFLVMLEYPVFYAIYIASLKPEIISVAPGLTAGMTMALTPIGAPAYWTTIIIRTLIIFIIGLILFLRLPTHLINPITLLRHLIDSYKVTRSQIKSQEGISN